ncbi:alpha/beta hydrolase family protein DUF1100 [Anaerobacterium chartisolvens]|uniref:Alpha/beta hydrolase family protein DUF1100 n=1 Tax=Anaerobacterium chartisolvens TaxID=1297424 RepID=A0A369ADD2_9FIRM|nr:alpha/beta hydrolase [Anaerobacterium chartisolvens]RCX07349.1 alpha/beta hydrolase family protein DUF1100 [Anaerobacterium chartisolvens]
MGSKRNLAKIWLCIALALCLISMIASNLLLTSGKKVKINDLNIAIPSGETIRVYEYRPDTATKNNPAPAVVFSHGNDSTLQTHQDYALELARRGFVVFALDITSAGHSSQVQDASTIGFGMYDLVNYVYYNLDYINNKKIGIAGYSKGGNNVYDTMIAYGKEQAQAPDKYIQRVNSALMIDPKFGTTENFATGINVGFACGTHDPYSRISFKPVDGYIPGDLTVKAEMKQFVNDGVPGTFSEADMGNPDVKVKLGTAYGSFEKGDARLVYNPEYSTHASGVFSKNSIRDFVDFFCKALGAPNYIDPSNQLSGWHKFFAAVGLLGIIIMIAPLTILLLGLKVFSPLNKNTGEPVVEFNSRVKRVYFILSGLILSFILPLTATKFGTGPSKFLSLNGHAGVSKFFLNSWQNNIVFWLFVNAVIVLAVFMAAYFIFYKKSGISLRDMGISASWRGALRTVLLAITVFSICYIVVCFADYTLKVDFRLQDLTFPVLTWKHLLECMHYAPFIIFFWCINSMNMNALNRIKGMKEWQNLLLCIGLNIVGIVVVLTIYYSKLFGTGVGLSTPFNWKYYTTMLLFVPIAISGTIINRVVYLKTKNVFVGPVIFGTIATIFSTAVMMLPDYLY